MSPQPSNELLRGLRSLRLTNFRGWVGQGPRLDTDAQIVLLTGSNGTGKTSLLEAVNLLVNGHCFDLRSEQRSFDQRLEDLVYRGGSGFALEAEGFHIDQRFNVEFQSGNLGLVWQGSYRPDQLHGPGGDAPPPDLLASATTYFQDRIDSILRDLDRSATLRDFLVPLPPEVERFRTQIEGLARQLAREADDGERQLDAARQPNPELQERAARFRQAWEALRQQETWLELPTAPSNLVAEQDRLAISLAAWLGREPAPQGDFAAFAQLLARTLDALDDRLRRRYLGQAMEDLTGLRAEADRICARLEVLDLTAPADLAERAVSQFGANADSDLPGLREVLRSVEIHLQRWRELAPELPATSELDPVLRELGRLDVGAAGVLRATLANWLEPWEAPHRERAQLRQRLSAIEGQLQGAFVVTDTRTLRQTLRDWQGTWDEEAERRNRLAEADRIRAQVTTRRRLAEVLDREVRGEGALAAVQALDDQVRADLARALDGTLVRFRFDRGFLPVRPLDAQRDRPDGTTGRGYELRTRDARPHYLLSTGQRGQVALAYMLAQALLLREELPHRVLVLDDTSTAFDLGNIVRQATWLRQIAYGEPAENRWQIFLASHHEELTNRLIELLVPPQGCELRLLRFRGWSPEEGPELEHRQARQNPPLDPEVRQRISNMLDAAWPGRPVESLGNA